MLNLVHHIQESNLSLEKLSAKANIGLDRLREILLGAEPSMSDLSKLSRALKLSIDFLISDDSEHQQLNLLFRKNIQNDSQKQYADRFTHMVGNSFKLLSDYNINKALIQNYNHAVANTYSNAEDLANRFREDFCNNDLYSPLLNLPQIIDEKLDCILYVTEFGNEIDGASAIINGIPYIFISPRFEPRMLYTLAHELAHILAHHDFNENFIKVDKNTSSRNSFKDEAFANAFASCLLLPLPGVTLTLQKLRQHYKNDGSIGDIEILYLSRIYGVSFEVAARRCEDLDLLPQGGAASLYQALKQNHGSPEKRAEEAGLPERFKITFPRVSSHLVRSALEKVKTGDISLGKVSEMLSVPIPVLISLNATAN
jgi:Zn-dependent peptidase ImmA (M78 family)